MSSPFLVSGFGFISFSFCRCRQARADNPGSLATFSVDHDDEVPRRRVTHGNEPRFVGGMERIGNRAGKRVAKDRRTVLKGHPMLGEIRFRLLGVPLELHSLIIIRRSPVSTVPLLALAERRLEPRSSLRPPASALARIDPGLLARSGPGRVLPAPPNHDGTVL